LVSFQEGQFGAHEYPQALDDITGKELALKVKAQPYFSIVSVLNLKNDPDIIQYIKDQLPTNEVQIFSYFLGFLINSHIYTTSLFCVYSLSDYISVSC
jgi:hypothetical protein